MSHSVWQTANSSACLATHLLMPLSRKSEEEEEEEECETFLQNKSQPTTLKLLKTGCVYICFAKESRRSAAFRTRPSLTFYTAVFTISLCDGDHSVFFVCFFFL